MKSFNHCHQLRSTFIDRVRRDPLLILLLGLMLRDSLHVINVTAPTAVIALTLDYVVKYGAAH